MSGIGTERTGRRAAWGDLCAVGLAAVAVAVFVGAAASAPPRPADPAPATRPATSPVDARAGLPYRSVSMQLQRVDWIDKYKASIDEVAALGADTVELIVDARQEDGGSNRIYLDHRVTPSAEALGGLIRHAKSRGLRVIVMPIVLLDDPKDDEWRGTLSPQDWGEWFESYREILLHFAWVGQGAGADVLVVGSELVSAERHEKEWRKTIVAAREVFKGKLTYSANWDVYAQVPFWDALDLVGMNSYWKLGDSPDVTVDEIVAEWRTIQRDLLPFVRKVGKPLLFTEIGWCSLPNAAEEPWDYTKKLPADPQIQRRLYEGFFRAWHGEKDLGGFSVWEWSPGDGGPDDTGYTPEGKPAADVLRAWLAKPWSDE